MLVLFILAGGLITVLAIENIATLMIGVHLTFFSWHAPTLPLGIVLLLSCVLGALLLYIVTVLSAWRERRELRRLRKRVAELEQAQAHISLQQASPPVIVPIPGIHNARSPYHAQWIRKR